MNESRNNQGEFRNIACPIRDPKYYYSDGNTVFLVGGCLFKVRINQFVSECCSQVTSASGVFTCLTFQQFL